MMEAIRDLETMAKLRSWISVPLMVNQLHGGKSPNWRFDELEDAGASILICSTPCLFAAQYGIEQYLDRMLETNRLPSENTVSMKDCARVLDGRASDLSLADVAPPANLAQGQMFAMTEVATGELVEFGIPIRLSRPVRLSSDRTVAAGVVRPTVLSSRVRDRFTDITGLAPETFTPALRMLAYESADSDELLATDAVSGLPLIVKRGNEIIACFDVDATQVLTFADSARPLYTYVPGFNIQRVPEGIRRPVSNVVQAFRTRTKSRRCHQLRRAPAHRFRVHCAAAVGRRGGRAAGARGAFEWPSGKRAVFVSLHDVDTRRLLRMKERSALFSVEQKHKIKSTWFVPTALLNRAPHAADFLLESGNEVGWHGHNHDHRDHVGRFAEVAAEALRSSWLSG